MKKIFIFFIFIFCSLPVNSQEKLIDLLKDGNKLIFIRHAYAPGSGDPTNFDLNDCSTQRNLNIKGINQSKKIGQLFFEKNRDFLLFFFNGFSNLVQILFLFEKIHFFINVHFFG